MTSTRRLLFAAVAVTALAGLSFTAVRFGVAGTASSNAAREIERISRGQVVGSASWKDDLRRAAVEVAGDPTVLELLAMSIESNTNDPAELAAARNLLLKAIEHRPGSGYAWASLSKAKYRLGETDTVFERSLVHAVELAPYEAEVQRDVVNYGLAVYDEARPVTRAAVDRALAAGVKRNPVEMLQIASRRGRLGAACRHLGDVPHTTTSKWTKLCESMEAKS